MNALLTVLAALLLVTPARLALSQEPPEPPDSGATDESLDQAVDEPADEAADEPADEAADEPADEAADEPAEGPAEDAAEVDKASAPAAAVPAAPAPASPPRGPFGAERRPTGTKIFVGGLFFTTTSDDLTALFGEFGEASCTIPTDQATGRSMLFATCEMPNESERQAAIAALDGRDLDGRRLTVKAQK